MSQENVDLVRRSIGAFNSGDWDESLEYMDEGIEWRAPFVVPDQDTYVGRDGVRAFWTAWTDNFEGFRLEVEDLIDAARTPSPTSLTCVTGKSAGGRCTTVRKKPSRRSSCGGRRCRLQTVVVGTVASHGKQQSRRLAASLARSGERSSAPACWTH